MEPDDTEPKIKGGETGNIQDAAQFVFEELFECFGWKQAGPVNQNWACTSPEHHGCAAHPMDMVVWYEDPHTEERVYLLTDLKSYKATSITKSQVRGAIKKLAIEADCANTNSHFKKLIQPGVCHWRCHGLLFVYNNDQEYSNPFEPVLEKLDLRDVVLSADQKVYVMGPQTVNYLSTIANDILRMRQKERIARFSEIWLSLLRYS